MIESHDSPARRVILLGASNLTRGITAVIETSRHTLGTSLDILVAHGHGRSYGKRSMVLCRALPSIIDCGLWRAIESRPALPTLALVTDIGNDLLYSFDVETVTRWITECVHRLQRIGARVVMTELPMCTIASISRARYLFFRTLFVPACRLSLKDMQDRAARLNEELRRLCLDRNVAHVVPNGRWYGIDPIHIKSRKYRDAWREILSRWEISAPRTNNVSLSLVRRAQLRLSAPERRWICAIEQQRLQPTAHFHDGTTISYY